MIPSESLDERERAELDELLRAAPSPDACRSLSELDGLVCAVAIGPALVLPEVWLAFALGEQSTTPTSVERVQTLVTLTLRHYNDVVRATGNGTYVPVLPMRAPKGAEHRAQPWAVAFLVGMSLDRTWKTLVESEHDSMMVMPMLYLADAKRVVKHSTPNDGGAESFIAMIPLVIPIVRAYWQRTPAGSLSKPPRRPSRASRPKAMATIHRLEIRLLDVKPAVWRRIELPSATKLPVVSRALLAAMGWTDTHLHAFRVGREIFSVPDEDFPNDYRDERRHTLAQVLPRENDSLVFDYDFGDGWEHRVTVEAILPADTRVRYPRCLAGKRACPPEDCGGPSGYADFLKALADPTHEEHEAMLEWGGPFDASRFDLDETNRTLGKFARAMRAVPSAPKL